MEDDVSIFGFKASVLVVTARDGHHSPTEAKGIILFYPSITQKMVESHFEILWADNSGAILERYDTGNYGAELNNPAKQIKIAQHLLRSKIIGLWIKFFYH